MRRRCGFGSVGRARRASGKRGRALGLLAARLPTLLLLLVAFGTLVASSAAPAADAGDPDARSRLARAIEAYEQAQAETDREARIAGFERAERGFASLIESGSASASLYTNLGHAALQAGRLGQAVLAYRRALRIDPEAVTARQNLAHVRAQLPAWVPRPVDVEGGEGWRDVHRRFPPATRSLAAAVCFALGAVAVAIAGRRRAPAWRGLAALSAVLWLVLLASVRFDPGRDEAATAAVLTADETNARVSDSALAALAFPEPLPAGVEVERLEARGDFARIRLAHGRDVWVRDSSVTPVGD